MGRDEVVVRGSSSPYEVDLHIRSRNLLQEAVSLAGVLTGAWTLLSLVSAFF
jgi:hypothetical protein